MPSQQPSDLQGHGREPEYGQKGNESTPKFGARKADGHRPPLVQAQPPGIRAGAQGYTPSTTGESTAAPFTYAL